MKTLLYIFVLAVSLIITGCNTRPDTSAIMKQGDEWMWENQNINAMMKLKKSKDIEREVITKIKEIQDKNENGITDVLVGRTLNEESYQLIALTCFALGNDTLNLLKKFKLDSTMEDVKIIVQPYIKKRLRLISLLGNYSPKNELEAKIVEKIREYPPCAFCISWPTEKKNIDYNYYHNEYSKFILHEYKIGPLNEGKYIYVKMFEENGVVDIVYVSDKEKGREKAVFVYLIDYKYPPVNTSAEK